MLVFYFKTLISLRLCRFLVTLFRSRDVSDRGHKQFDHYSKSRHVCFLWKMLARCVFLVAMVAGTTAFSLNQMPSLHHAALSLRGQPRRASEGHGLRMAVKDITSESDLDSTIAAAGFTFIQTHNPHLIIPSIVLIWFGFPSFPCLFS